MTPTSNALIHETSPYLIQHAHQPVVWRPWGDPALQEAVQQDKPILLSVGYATCHWCHVMAHESFEDVDVAAFLNQHFIPIKVDREERPDVDAYYMTALQAMTGQGGWPMTLVLTPQGQPIYAATYLPPQRRQALPGFLEMLTAVEEAWRTQREALLRSGQAVTERLLASQATPPPSNRPEVALLANAVDQAARGYDEVYGGFTLAPKFPQPTQLHLLLGLHVATGDPVPLRMVRHALDRMAAGGIHDQLGGGFHRYSVDDQWLVPHFEKMLYDQALLMDVYRLAWQIQGQAGDARVIERIAGFVQRELCNPGGGFYSALDADTQGDEGATYVWDSQTLEALLEADETEAFGAVYETLSQGNWEGKLILRRLRTPEDAASDLGMDLSRLRDLLDRAEAKLLAYRRRCAQPLVDDKILVDWNGLMISALARAGRVMDRPEWVKLALDAADFIQRWLMEGDVLFHSFRLHRAPVRGFLADHAYWTAALLALYEATGDGAWMEQAQHWQGLTEQRFGDGQGGFYATEASEQLPLRQRMVVDAPLPSPEGVALGNRLVLATWWGDHVETGRTHEALMRESALMARYSGAMATFLERLLWKHAGSATAVLSGPINHPQVEALRRALDRLPWPGRVLGYAATETSPIAQWPLLKGKAGSEPVLHLCAGQACFPPVKSVEPLQALYRSLQISL